MLVDDQTKAAIANRFALLSPSLDERQLRLWAATEAIALGYGGVAAVSAATGIAVSTIGAGKREIRSGEALSNVARTRRPGGGRQRLEVKQPQLLEKIERLVDPATRGDPESPLKWSSKSLRQLARTLTDDGIPVSANTVGQLLRKQGYSLQGTSRVNEGKSHPDRNAQFEFINERAKDCLARNVPVISVDTKKKELVGEKMNAGREWQPAKTPVKVDTYDFVDINKPKAVPYGVYDVGANKGFVNVGTDADTPKFSVQSIRRWWQLMGSARHHGAKELFITADAGGSNGFRVNTWKVRLQEFADETGLTIHVSHFPPGTSKWNKIEHRLFSFITMNWRGRPLETYETIVSLISGTTTSKGLQVTAELDTAKYPKGETTNSTALKFLALERAAFHSDWNYTLRPRTPEDIEAAKRQMPRKRVSRRPFWEQMLAEQKKSGLSIKRFCTKHGLSSVSFFSWKRMLTGKDTNQPRRAFWMSAFALQTQSGLSVTAYCEAHDLKRKTFFEAQRRYLPLKSKH